MVVDMPGGLFKDPGKQFDDEVIAGQVKPRTVAYFVGQDSTSGSVTDTTVETEVLDFNIPAGTIVNGIIATIWFNSNKRGADDGSVTWRIKAGTNGSEVTKGDCSESTLGRAINERFLFSFSTVVDDLDWKAAQTVSVTAQHSTEAGTGLSSVGFHLSIMGF